MSRYIRMGIFTIIGLFLVYSLSKTIFDYQKKLHFYQQYKKDYEEKLKKNQELMTAIVKGQDSYSVERVARDKLNLTKPGEIVVIIPKSSPTPTPTPTPIKPVFRQWLEVFFK